MFSPLTSILIKTIGRSFYRANAGLLLALFVTFAIYCLFIGVLNETHIPADQRIYYNLIFVLGFISSPVIMLFVFVLWLIYTIKSWSHVQKELSLEENQFLYYSSTSFTKNDQFKSWLLLQGYIVLPIVGYGIFSVVIGMLFGYYVLPLVIVGYIAILIGVSAVIYVRVANQPIDAERPSLFLTMTRLWPKPFFSLFLYHIADQLKVPLLITKAVSWFILLAVRYSFTESENEWRLASFAALGVGVAHCVLVFEYRRFEAFYMQFSRNLPYRQSRLFLFLGLLYVLLLAPEAVGLFATYPAVIALPSLWLALTLLLLLHSLLYPLGLNMKVYLRWVFGLFISVFLLISFDLVWLLIPLVPIVAWVVFYRNYYQQLPTAP